MLQAFQHYHRMAGTNWKDTKCIRKMGEGEFWQRAVGDFLSEHGIIHEQLPHIPSSLNRMLLLRHAHRLSWILFRSICMRGSYQEFGQSGCELWSTSGLYTPVSPSWGPHMSFVVWKEPDDCSPSFLLGVCICGVTDEVIGVTLNDRLIKCVYLAIWSDIYCLALIIPMGQGLLISRHHFWGGGFLIRTLDAGSCKANLTMSTTPDSCNGDPKYIR